MDVPERIPPASLTGLVSWTTVQLSLSALLRRIAPILKVRKSACGYLRSTVVTPCEQENVANIEAFDGLLRTMSKLAPMRRAAAVHA
jgi:hypothetical protein